MELHEGTTGHRGIGLLIIYVVLSAGIVASGYFFYGSYKRQFRAEIERQLTAVAELKTSELVDWRKERQADAAVFYKNATFSSLVRRLFEKPDDSTARGQLWVWLSRIQEAYGYNRVFLLDVHGVERLSAPDTSEPVAAHLLEQAPDILRSGRVTFVDFHRDAPDGPIHMSVLVPVLDGEEDTGAMGIFVFRMDPETYLYPYISRWPTPSRTAETLLVRRDGNDVLFLNELRFQKNTALNLRIPLGSQDVLAVKAALGQTGLVKGVDYRGAPVLGAGGGIGFVWRYQRARYFREKYEASRAMDIVSGRNDAILAAIPDIIMEADTDKVYTWANRAGLEFFDGHDSPGLGIVRSLTEILGRKEITPGALEVGGTQRRSCALHVARGRVTYTVGDSEQRTLWEAKALGLRSADKGGGSSLKEVIA